MRRERTARAWARPPHVEPATARRRFDPVVRLLLLARGANDRLRDKDGGASALLMDAASSVTDWNSELTGVVLDGPSSRGDMLAEWPRPGTPAVRLRDSWAGNDVTNKRGAS